jgi:hypothetical protein
VPVPIFRSKDSKKEGWPKVVKGGMICFKFKKQNSKDKIKDGLMGRAN